MTDRVFAERTLKAEDGKQWYTFTAKLYHTGGNRDARLSITGETGNIVALSNGRTVKAKPHIFGCLHDDFARLFPDYANAIPFHLAGPRTGPMHYVPNGLYWLGLTENEDARSWDNFAKHIAADVTGWSGQAVMDDVTHILTMCFINRSIDKEQAFEMATDLLNAHLPYYLEAMHYQLDNLFPDHPLFGTDWDVVPAPAKENES